MGEDPRCNISGNDLLRDALRAHLLTSLHQKSDNSEQHMTTGDQPGPHPELAMQICTSLGCANAPIW